MAKASTTLEQLQEEFTGSSEAIFNDFKTFLRFASVSADPEQTPQVRACSEWVHQFLERIGFQVQVWETTGHPTLFAQDLTAGPDKPTVLIYNHYDVQPVDPVELWETPPFEPTIKGNAIYARGAQDNKGQCFYVLQALTSLKKLQGRLPINVKLVIEGEEETGSAGLAQILDKKAKELKADYLFIVDVGTPKEDCPSITVGLRGIVALEVTCKGSHTDLHSGCHGGMAYNPIHALVEILAKLRDASGHITVPGFYDDVQTLSEQEKNKFTFEMDAERYQKEFGVKPTGGEINYPPLERNWLRPTLEINGVTGGFSGAGVKTVIPAIASAKITCRLVANQEPEKIARLVTHYIETLAPDGIAVSTHIHPGGGCPVITDPDSKAAKAVSQAFTEVFGKPCINILEGASIPIVTNLQKICGGQVVLLGLGLGTDLIHAPNEHFGLDRVLRGFLIIARSLEILGT